MCAGVLYTYDVDMCTHIHIYDVGMCAFIHLYDADVCARGMCTIYTYMMLICEAVTPATSSHRIHTHTHTHLHTHIHYIYIYVH